MFLAQRERAEFCSTSCRSLYHRALKTAMPEALAAAFAMPMDRAVEVLETQPVGKLRKLLNDVGYVYYYPWRRWASFPDCFFTEDDFPRPPL